MVCHSFASSQDNLVTVPSDVSALVTDLDAALADLEKCSLDEAGSPAAPASAVRDSLRRLVSISAADPGNIGLQKTALKRLEDVLGREHEGYLALWRLVSGAPHASDWEYQAWEN